jgi:nitroreductase
MKGHDMELFEALYSRKTIRSYTGEPISNDDLETILKAGYAAPVGMGRYDNLHFTVITNAELIAEIDACGAKMMGDPARHPLYGAPTLVVISTPKAEPQTANILYSNAAGVAENMALAAVDLGVGVTHIWGCTAALRADAELVEKLGLPEGFEPACSVALGKTELVYEPREIGETIATDVIA